MLTQDQMGPRLPLDTIQIACHQAFPNTDMDVPIDRLLAKPTEDER